MAEILDYAGGVPSGAAVKAAGYAGVIRYLKKNGSSSISVLTLAEYNNMQLNTRTVTYIYEAPSASRMLGGYSAGVADATWARDQVPATPIRCIYFTADFDVQPGQYAAVRAYLDGAASVLGKSVVGLYGGIHAIDNCGSHAFWLWQTAAWSGGKISGAGINLYQHIGYVSVGGVTCDRSTTYTVDYGQHPKPIADPPPATGGNMSLSTEDIEAVANRTRTIVRDTAGLATAAQAVALDGGLDEVRSRLADLQIKTGQLVQDVADIKLKVGA